jgi:rhodanese-related sulfurtransferase
MEPEVFREFFRYIIILFIGLLGGFLGSLLFDYYKSNKKEMLIKEYYELENAVLVSPHSLRKKIDSGENDFVLVDLRSEEEYNKSHIKGAVNIPAYKDKDTPDYNNKQRILEAFKKLKEQNPDKDIIVYCYSISCMTGRKIGKFLAENGIYVKHLGIGWNEWRYYWTLWNHEHEWNITKPEEYIESVNDKEKTGSSSSNTKKTKGCPIEGDFGC